MKYCQICEKIEVRFDAEICDGCARDDDTMVKAVEKHKAKQIKQPKIKVGDAVEDFNGHDYKVLEVSNTYPEVSKYDSCDMCFDYSTDEQLVEIGLDPEDVLYCAVMNSFGKTFVFIISRDSTILGE